VTTITFHLRNMIKGVIQGYKFVMKFAYAHFPIQSNLTNDNKTIEIKNLLEKGMCARSMHLKDTHLIKKRIIRMKSL